MKRENELAAEIRAYCTANENQQEARRYTRFFREGYDAWGIHKEHPMWTEKQAEWLERYRGLGLKGFLQAGELLFSSGKYEEGSLAIRFLITFRDQLDGAVLEPLAGYFRSGGIRNWAHTDVLCGEILSPLLASGRFRLAALAQWRTAEPKFQRRAVPVSMLGLLKTDAPVKPLLAFIEPLMMDSERVVQQGLGWFLREAWKKEPKPVEEFLRKWKDRAPRLIFQYATEKMTAGQKARFRRK